MNEMLLHASTAVEHGRLAEAEALARKKLDNNPNHPDANFLLGLIAG